MSFCLRPNHLSGKKHLLCSYFEMTCTHRYAFLTADGICNIQNIYIYNDKQNSIDDNTWYLLHLMSLSAA